MQLTPPPTLRAEIAPPPAGVIVLLVLAMLAPFALYFSTAKSFVEIWNSSETFAHGYVILPICLWLIWRRRVNFSLVQPAPCWPALIPLALCGAAWLLARLGDVQVVQQYAFAAMLPATAWAVFGRRLAASLAFPLLFVLAAVPFGEIFVDPLINFTADFTVKALQLTGIPVLRTGTYFEIPSGNWSVVEACSGVRYLISSITIGLLYAYLTYRSNVRRAAFVLLSVVVPVVANGLRAYMIVMIGHLSSMKLAVGVDHIIYGWLFFGLVMFLMFWIGNFWREDESPAPERIELPAGAAATGGSRALAPVVAATILLGALWPAFAAYRNTLADTRPVQLAQPAIGWPTAPGFSTWVPDYMTPDASFNNAYRQGDGAPVALTLLYYRNQQKNKSLVSSINHIAEEHNPYASTYTGLRLETINGRPFQIRETRLRNPAGPIIVWHWNWIDNKVTANDYQGKLWQTEAKLAMRPDDGAAIMVSSPLGENPEQARASLRAFLQANLAPIEAALAQTRSR
ncbi:MAG: exosortase A [Massilia sp.]